MPGREELSLDIRDVDEDRIGAFFLELQGEAAGIGQRTGTEFSFTRYHQHEPVETHPVIRDVLEELVRQTVTLSPGAVNSFTDTPRRTAALKMRAPSRCTFSPRDAAVAQSSRTCCNERQQPPAAFT